jgi:hypothetical protein
MPLNCNLFSGNDNDSLILNNQLDDIIINNTELLNNKNILLGDAGYDSNIIKNKLKKINFGKLLSYRNKRNIKNVHKLEAIKLLPSEKELLKKRIKIEHTNALLKQYRRLSTRYDKYSSNYMIFLYLACSDIILKNINK